MADKFKPQTFELSSINNGNRYGLEGIQPEAVNAPIEAAAYAQALATNPLDTTNANNVGTPKVSIQKMANGTPQLKFENLKGEKGDDGIDGITPDMSDYYTKAEINQKTSIIEKEINNLYAITGATVTDEYPLSQAYSTRETADGNADIIDGALTRVTKIQGATVATTNLIDITAETQTVSGVTFTKDTDNSFTVNGTATDTIYKFVGRASNLPSGSYVLSGMPSTSSRSTYYAYGEYKDENGVIQYVNNDSAIGAFTKKNTSTVNVYIYVASGKTVNFTAYPMLNAGTTAFPYRPYFSGLKNAYFKGIRSTGKNLFTTATKYYHQFGTYSNLGTNGFELVNNAYTDVTMLEYHVPLGAGVYRLSFLLTAKNSPDESYRPNSVIVMADGEQRVILSMGNDQAAQFHQYEFTVSKYQVVKIFFYHSINPISTITNQSMVVENIQLEYGDTATEYEPYKADESFMLDEAVPLGAWDYIDIQEENGIISATIIKQTATATSETAFTEEHLAEYTDYVLSADGLTVAYKAQSIIDEQSLAIPTSKYKSWVHGSETQKQGDTSDTDNSADGANCTVSQDYYTQKGA